MKKIYLFVDYRGQFYVSAKQRGASVDIGQLKMNFSKAGYEIVVKKFFEVDLRNENYKNEWVLYQSVEDPGLRYKNYIEDVVLALQIQGAKLIPDFKYFRAHHNKVFMELLRDLSYVKEIKNISTKSFGSFEDYKESNFSISTETFIIKPSAGAGSSSIKLLRSKKDKRDIPYSISRTFTLDNFKLFLSKIRTGKSFVPMSNNRNKFIIQNFISDLKGDYRIIIYGDKYYSVFRSNRKNDFRASGSGIVDYEPILPDGILDFAENIYKQFNTPYMTMDIGYKNEDFYLFEFQCISFKPIFFERSQFYHKKDSNKSWKKVFEEPNLERELAVSIISYIEKYNQFYNLE
jgi:glutathione synthase/RimK-type ligase-like ATP-grasp enzyme